jgi:putative membrane protein
MLNTHLPTSAHRSLTLANHFAYGAACGALYALVARKLPFSPPLNGMLFGLGVWTGSYVGWLPLFQVMPSAAKQPAPRNALMLVAHMIWGVSVGVLTNTFTPRQVQDERGT